MGTEAPPHPPLSACFLLNVLTPTPQDLYELAFSISYDCGEEEAYLNFIAPSKRDVSAWAGLLGACAGEQMDSLTESALSILSSACGQMG